MRYQGQVNVPGAPGNLLPYVPPFPPQAYVPGQPQPLGNASFFYGPQVGQMPAGFASKTVS